MVTQSKVRKNERRLTGRHDTEHELRISEVGAAGRALAKLHAVGAGNADQVVCKKKTKLICLAGNAVSAHASVGIAEISEDHIRLQSARQRDTV